MSLYDYERSKALSDEPFYTMIMAAMRQADDENLYKLRAVFPEVWDELQARYNAPGGRIPEDEQEMIDEVVCITCERPVEMVGGLWYHADVDDANEKAGEEIDMNHAASPRTR